MKQKGYTLYLILVASFMLLLIVLLGNKLYETKYPGTNLISSLPKINRLLSFAVQTKHPSNQKNLSFSKASAGKKSVALPALTLTSIKTSDDFATVNSALNETDLGGFDSQLNQLSQDNKSL